MMELADEIKRVPGVRNMSDSEVADYFNAPAARLKNTLSGAECWAAVEQTEWLLLVDKADAREVFTFDVVDVSDGSRARMVLEAIGPTTTANLEAVRTDQVTRAENIGITDIVGRGAVINARREIGFYTRDDQNSKSEMGRP